MDIKAEQSNPGAVDTLSGLLIGKVPADIDREQLRETRSAEKLTQE